MSFNLDFLKGINLGELKAFDFNSQSKLKVKELPAQERVKIYKLLKRFAEQDIQPMKALSERIKQMTSIDPEGFKQEIRMYTSWLNNFKNKSSVSYMLNGWIPDAEAAVLAACEENDQLVNGFDSVIESIDIQAKVKGVWLGLLMPSAVFCLSIIVIILFSKLVIPGFGEAFSRGLEWPWLAVKYRGIGDHLVYVFPVICLCVLCYFFWAKAMCPVLVSSFRLKFLDRVPPFSMYKRETSIQLLGVFAGFAKGKIKIKSGALAMLPYSTPLQRFYLEKMLDNLKGKKEGGETFNIGLLSNIDLVDLKSADSLSTFGDAIRDVVNTAIQNNEDRARSVVTFLMTSNLIFAVGVVFITFAVLAVIGLEMRKLT